MPDDVTLIVDEVRRHAFRFEPDVVRRMVPHETLGTYCLLVDRAPVYIGRSDTCLRGRLAAHPLLGEAEHFVWSAGSGPWATFCMEAFWWHRLAGSPTLRNAIHPAVPKGEQRTCPFCISEEGALRLALPPLSRTVR